jgi:hypothetical protein
MPEQEDGLMEGFQLWLNLPARDKLCPPWYRDIPGAEIPEFTAAGGVSVRVIAGTSHGTVGAMQRETTTPLILDIHFGTGHSFRQSLPETHNAFVYVYRGKVRIGDVSLTERKMGILSNGAGSDGVVLHADGPARALLIAGMPLNEPIAQYGPFVMNTQQEINQAVIDYQNGRF